jgi:hypothetical protein
MGDHRIAFSIKAEFHGVKREYPDCWLNWSDSICGGVPDQVVEFFRELHERGMEAYEERVAQYNAEQNASRIEREERAELARLRAKYKDTR